MNNTEFMSGVAAELWKKRVRRLDPRDPASHRAFYDTLREIDGGIVEKAGLEFYFDPITGNIADLFNLSSSLQGFALGRRPNPTYPETELVLSSEASEELLSILKSEERSLVSSFAERFARKLQATESVIGI